MKKTQTKSMILIALFAALTAVGAYIRIPMWPVPISLQFLFTAFAGVLLGGRRAAASQLIYLLVGLIGIPVFTEGGGIGYIAHPSFGYLLGLIPAAYIIGLLAQNKKGFFQISAACVTGLAVLYAIGVPYMFVMVKYVMGAELTPTGALYSGMLLFLPGDLVKIAAVSLLAGQIRRRMKNALL